jgi:peptidoglycan/xylan/chitin deacetylase (PgdA/CDA1 family)
MEVTGVDTTIVRPPYGDFNQNSWLMSQGAMSASILWNQDTRDWEVPGVDAIVNNALNSIQPGSIILMHDGGGNRDQDVEALPRIIEQLQANGYRLVTISELLASDPDIPAEIAAGNAKMPEGTVWSTEISAPEPQGE